MTNEIESTVAVNRPDVRGLEFDDANPVGSWYYVRPGTDRACFGPILTAPGTSTVFCVIDPASLRFAALDLAGFTDDGAVIELDFNHPISHERAHG